MTALRDINPQRHAEMWLANQIARGRREVFSVVAPLTPELAALLLKNNDHNRAPKSIIHQFKTDMIEGRWELNGESIVIASTGEVNNGQHRLRAVAETGCTIQTVITFGVSRDTRFSTDTGTVKSPGDLLTMREYTDGNNLAAVASYLWQIDTRGRIPVVSHSPQNRPTKQQVQATVAIYADKIQDAFRKIQKSTKVCSYSLSITAYLYIGAITGDEDAAGAYINQLAKGANLDENDPIFVARERMLDEKRRRSLWPAKAMEIILRGWNFHRRGERPTRIQLMGEWPKVVR